MRVCTRRTFNKDNDGKAFIQKFGMEGRKFNIEYSGRDETSSYVFILSCSYVCVY